MRNITKKEFVEFIYPDYYKHKAMIEATDRMYESFKDKILMNDKPISNEAVYLDKSPDTVIVGNYEIMLYDWSEKVPKGNSYTVNGKVYYDYEAAVSIKFPDGFKLPTTKEWFYICNLLNNNSTEIMNVLKLNLHGQYVNNSIDSFGKSGYYWSNTGYSTHRAYNLYFTCDNVYPQEYDIKQYGLSIRGIKIINE